MSVILPVIKLKAEAIVRQHTAHGRVTTYTLFNPDPDTMERLRAAEPGDKFNGMIVIDTFDSGDEDVNIIDQIQTFVELHPANADKNQVRFVSFTHG